MGQDKTKTGEKPTGDAAGAGTPEPSESIELDKAAQDAFAKIEAGDEEGTDDGAAGRKPEKAPETPKPQDAGEFSLTRAQKGAMKDLGLTESDVKAMGEKGLAVLDAHAKRVSTLAGSRGAEMQRTKRIAEAMARLAGGTPKAPESGTGRKSSAEPEIEEFAGDDLLDGDSGAKKLNTVLKRFAQSNEQLRAELLAAVAGNNTEADAESVVNDFFDGLDSDLYPQLAGEDADSEARADIIEDAADLLQERRTAGRPYSLLRALRKVLPQPAPERLTERAVGKYVAKLIDRRGQATRNPSGRAAGTGPDPDKQKWRELGEHRVWKEINAAP